MPAEILHSNTRKPANLSIDSGLMAEARALDINISRAAEIGIAKAVAEAKTIAWKRENAAAIDSSNAFADANGLPLGQHRQF